MGYSAKKDKKTDGRMTPFDARVRGTFAEPPLETKEPPRGPTPGEQRANNTAMVEFARGKSSVEGWIPIFRMELEEMNRGKRGRPYDYCDSMILWILSIMTLNSSTFRCTAGFVAGILKSHGLKAPSYSRLHERAAELLDSMISDSRSKKDILVLKASGIIRAEERNVGIDSSGFNLSDTTLWRNTKWGTGPKKKGWLKLHALCDTDTGEIIAYAITGERVGDSPLLKPLLEAAVKAGHRIGRVYADGAYGSIDNFEYVCGTLGKEFVTSFRVDTQPKNHGSSHRGKAVRLWCELPYREWVRVSGYGRRWKSECTFSDLKRIFRETLNAHTVKGAVRRLILKTEEFNQYKAIRWGIMQDSKVPA